MKRSNLKGREAVIIIVLFFIVKLKLRFLQTFTSVSAVSAIVIS